MSVYMCERVNLHPGAVRGAHGAQLLVLRMVNGPRLQYHSEAAEMV
jgi:hypothetical protein